VTRSSIVFASFALLLGACTPEQAEAPHEEDHHEEARSLTTKWIEVERPSDASLLELPAKIVAAADTRARIDAPLQGAVVGVFVQIGDRVEPGAKLVELRMPEAVVAAAILAGTNAQLGAHKTLVRSTQDRVSSVRSAAIDALGASTSASAVGEQVMGLLEKAESPIVQLALVDHVLRYGNEEQIDQLLTLAGQDRLHPDLARHVIASVQGDTA
jgi:multidrug efflux pump subunit AcrA (membrane-fusion protein)